MDSRILFSLFAVHCSLTTGEAGLPFGRAILTGGKLLFDHDGN
jgi:hypothetical protein